MLLFFKALFFFLLINTSILYAQVIDCSTIPGFTGFGSIDTEALNVRTAPNKSTGKIVDVYMRGAPIKISECTDTGWVKTSDGKWLSRNFSKYTNRRYVKFITQEEALKKGLKGLQSIVTDNESKDCVEFDADENDDVDSLHLKTLKDDEYFCPAHFYELLYLTEDKKVTSPRICSNTASKKTKALGPFTTEMVRLCKKYGGGKACDKNLWDLNFAINLRGKGTCPKGSRLSSIYKVCYDSKYVYGPFKKKDILRCIKANGGKSCKSMRWDLAFFKKITIENKESVKPSKPTSPSTPVTKPKKPNYARAGLTSKLASNAKRYAAGRTRGSGWCYEKTWYALKASTGISEKTADRIGVPVAHAYQFGTWASNNPISLAKHFGLRRVYNVTGASAPVGSVLVYDRYQCGFNGKSGHIEVKVSKWRACSDFCAPIRNCRPKVFAPIMNTPSSPVSPPREVASSYSPKGTKLNVSSRYQYDNKYEPISTCGLTAGSMLISYKKGYTVSPDTLYKKYGKYKGMSPEGLSRMYKDYGLKGRYSRRATRKQIKELLDSGTPVVIHGYFSRKGHIVTITGYDDEGFFVNDPAGKWNGRYNGSYNGWGGNKHKYSYSSFSNSVIGSDGDIWISWVDK